MILSKSTAYGIRALFYLAQHQTRVCGLHEIAQKMEIPRVYLSKIMSELRRHRLICSTKGVHGGYKLICSPDTISFWDVFTILEPDPFVDQCLLARGICRPDAACEAHREWDTIRAQLIRFLQQKTISNPPDCP